MTRIYKIVEVDQRNFQIGMYVMKCKQTNKKKKNQKGTTNRISKSNI